MYKPDSGSMVMPPPIAFTSSSVKKMSIATAFCKQLCTELPAIGPTFCQVVPQSIHLRSWSPNVGRKFWINNAFQSTSFVEHEPGGEFHLLPCWGNLSCCRFCWITVSQIRAVLIEDRLLRERGVPISQGLQNVDIGLQALNLIVLVCTTKHTNNAKETSHGIVTEH